MRWGNRGMSGTVRQCLAGGAAVQPIDTVFTWCALVAARQALLAGSLLTPGQQH